MVFQVNVPVGEAKQGETAPRRNYKVADGAVSRPAGIKGSTVFDYFNECVAMNSRHKAQAWRDLKAVHIETKKVTKLVDGQMQQVDKDWTYYELSDYSSITFTDLQELVNDYGRGIAKLGVLPGDVERLHIFASTSAKWMRTYLATQTMAIPIVTAYDTLGEEGLTHSLVETGSVAVFTDNDLLVKLVNPLKKADKVRYIIHSSPLDPADKIANGAYYAKAAAAIENIKQTRPDIQVISYDDVIALGKANRDIPQVPPKADNLSCIMYTSGSTGTPKGVVLTHRNIVAGLGGISVVIDRSTVTTDDRVIAFLPLAHIFELAFELIGFWWGGCVGYAAVKTLTDASCKNCLGDMRAFEPTVMVGVAAVWESVRKGILAKVEQTPSITQKVFWAAYKAKLGMKNWHIPGTSLIDTLIFKKVKAATGGHLKLLLNGGSPISGATQRFISNLIAPMLVGYGLTETVANCTILDPDHFEYDVAGALLGSITVKLVDVPDAGYLAKNNQGEVLIRGLPVFSEYYRNQKETDAAFAYDREWFSTGDIGEWTESGQLKLIDRKKNLIKTQNGEYIALEKLESTYRSNVHVANICCYADETKVKPVGIVVPNEKVLKDLAVQIGIIKNPEDKSLAELVTNKKLCKAVNKSLLETGRQHGLAGIELILGCVLLDEEWTPENGYVTSAQKLQRKKILQHSKDRIDQLYAENS
ncbi:unnamed protein product [Kuraishia capsulata CBS 1993]|uniref:AMP-dependent synthetase/ligase domain-containing protein n=1 Tax=Kuraishia capsulata CBS 1993 TaxID=1382522 RepID=W6MU87_9ASCO|nr:uncharacterized protein KUCA_T00004968001 [Kuraishia capsulata CBS 1993]CDK28982.1 unnamed protein product [Kuraishia capsulata CBS 1993]